MSPSFPTGQDTDPPTRPPTTPCCVDSDFCPADEFTFELPLLNLYLGSPQRPVIDGRIDQNNDDIGDDLIGWNGTEYIPFIEIPMYIGGKNNDPSDRMGTAYLAYDCTYEILCAAAHLDQDYMDENPGVSVIENEEESWIRIGNHGSDPKLTQNLTDEFMYVGTPENRSFLIGYEGCWNTTGLVVMNNFVEVHFVTTEDDTISSGKDVRKGDYICMKPICESSTPTQSPTPVSTGRDTPSPTDPRCIPTFGPCNDNEASCCDGTKCTEVSEEGEKKCLQIDDTCCECPTTAPSSSPTATPTVPVPRLRSILDFNHKPQGLRG